MNPPRLPGWPSVWKHVLELNHRLAPRRDCEEAPHAQTGSYREPPPAAGISCQPGCQSGYRDQRPPKPYMILPQNHHQKGATTAEPPPEGAKSNSLPREEAKPRPTQPPLRSAPARAIAPGPTTAEGPKIRRGPWGRTAAVVIVAHLSRGNLGPPLPGQTAPKQTPPCHRPGRRRNPCPRARPPVKRQGG